MDRKNYGKNKYDHRKSLSRKEEFRGVEILKPGMSFYILGINQDEKSVDFTNNDRGFIRMRPKVVSALLVPDFKLVQLYLKPDSEVNPEDLIVHPASGNIIKIKRRVNYESLNPNEQLILPSVIEKYIRDNPDIFLQTIHNAPSLSLTKHSLELLPNVGKKTMQNIIKEMEIKKFESLEDLKKRGGLGINAIVERIIEEIKSDDEKHYMFLKWKAKKEEIPMKKSSNVVKKIEKNQSKRTMPYKNVGGFQNDR